MTHEEWAAERKLAAKDPAKYCAERGIFRLESLAESCRPGWCIFWLFGIWPGSFLSAVIRNDLMGALGTADAMNNIQLRSIAAWFNKYGDPRAMKGNADAWAEKGGHFGKTMPDPDNG